MDSSTLHQLWLVVEEMQAKHLLWLNDVDLVREIVARLEDRRPLTYDEMRAVNAYLKARTPLIRDLAVDRFACG